MSDDDEFKKESKGWIDNEVVSLFCECTKGTKLQIATKLERSNKIIGKERMNEQQQVHSQSPFIFIHTKPADRVVDDRRKEAPGTPKKPCIGGVGNSLVYPILAYMFSNSFSDISATSNEGLSQVRKLAFTFMVIGCYALVAATIQSSCFEYVAYHAMHRFQVQWFQALLRQDAAFLMSTMSTVLPNKLVPMRPNSVAGSGANLAAASNIFACRHVGCSQEETAGASAVAAAVSNVVVIVVAILGCFQQESAIARASAAAASNIVIIISVVVKKKLLKPLQQQQQYPTLSSS